MVGGGLPKQGGGAREVGAGGEFDGFDVAEVGEEAGGLPFGGQHQGGGVGGEVREGGETAGIGGAGAAGGDGAAEIGAEEGFGVAQVEGEALGEDVDGLAAFEGQEVDGGGQ